MTSRSQNGSPTKKALSKGYTKFLAAGGKDQWLDDFMRTVRLNAPIGSRGMGRSPMRGEILEIVKEEVRHVMDPVYCLVLGAGNYRYFDSRLDAVGARMLRNIRDPSKTIASAGALFSG